MVYQCKLFVDPLGLKIFDVMICVGFKIFNGIYMVKMLGENDSLLKNSLLSCEIKWSINAKKSTLKILP